MHTRHIDTHYAYREWIERVSYMTWQIKDKDKYQTYSVWHEGFLLGHSPRKLSEP